MMSDPPATMDSTDDVLPCGAPFAALVDQVDAGRREPVDVHQATCPHCRSALRTSAPLDQALALLRAATGPTPHDLVDRVMNEVRQTQGGELLIELPAGPPRAGRSAVAGGVRVRRQVVADLARGAAATLLGVTVAHAAARARPGAPDAVDVRLELLVDGRTPLPELARQVRQQVRAVLRRSLGSFDVQVDVAALDLLDPD